MNSVKLLLASQNRLSIHNTTYLSRLLSAIICAIIKVALLGPFFVNVINEGEEI